MARCLALLVQLAFVTFIADNAVRSLEPADIRANVELANEKSASGDRKYEIEIQFNLHPGKSVVQSARKLFKYLKKWKKSYNAEVELAECFVGYLREEFLRLDLNSCPKNDEYGESRDYLSKMRFDNDDEHSGRLKQESNSIPDFNEGNWTHGSGREEATSWAPHPGEGGDISGWEEQQVKHLLDLLKGKAKGSCELKRATARLLHKLYLHLTTFFSKNLLSACVIKYVFKKFSKWVDSAP